MIPCAGDGGHGGGAQAAPPFVEWAGLPCGISDLNDEVGDPVSQPSRSADVFGIKEVLAAGS